ncbi:MAG: VWA domain-containing protein [Kiritimatiellae bacterium]|nr:VWA domain-containing protein [Kiritimatiellia bacterium]
MRIQALTLFGVLLALSGTVAQEVYIDNVVIVLDASGSMNENMRGTTTRKIRAAKTAIREVMKTIPPSTHVGLLVFGGQADGWVYPLGGRDDAKLLAAVDRLSAGGGTPLGAYMKQGAERLLAARKAQYGYGSYRLLVVTDGEATDRPLVEAYTPDIIARGIVTDVIGVDMAAAHTLATKVHAYRRANDPRALQQAIQEVFAEVGRAAAGQSGESAFEELAALPEETALAAISALTAAADQPIGEGPAARAAPRVAAAQRPAAPAAGQPRSPRPAKPSPRGAQERGRKSGSSTLLWVFAAVVVVIVLSKRKGRRR